MSLEKSIRPLERLQTLKECLDRKGFARILEAHSGLSALIAESAQIQRDGEVIEYDGIWESSLTDSATKGLPDASIVGFDSRIHTTDEILNVTTKPVIVDGDTGGEPALFEYLVKRLERLGVPQATIETARRYIFEPGISVVPEALAACAAVRAGGGAVHAMHDPTEGGLATALYELAEASGLGMSVQEEAITVLPETRAICSAASLEPLGLLASGALLIAVAEKDCGTVLAALAGAGIGASRIGTMVKREAGVIMDGLARTMKVPRFARDEVARFLAG